MARRRRTVPERLAKWVPGVTWLARFFARIAAVKAGGLPVGLLALLPVAVLLDVLDFFDEALPVVGTVASFIVETGFVLGLTGRPAYALGFAACDVVPFVDVVPVATLATLSALREQWTAGATAGRHEPSGPVIDV